VVARFLRENPFSRAGRTGTAVILRQNQVAGVFAQEGGQI
jgi:hypothetical protein